jgi:predicted transcriptional regulator
MPDNRASALRGLDTTQRAWRLYIEFGWSMSRIAAELGITKGAVSKAMRRGEQHAIAELKTTISAHKAKALERLEWLYYEARDAWERSKEPHTKKLSRQRKPADDEKAVPSTTTQLVTEETVGDPRYLSEARMCIDRICKLLGIDSPAKVALVDPDKEFEGVTDEELTRDLARMCKAAGIDPLQLAAMAAEPKGTM